MPDRDSALTAPFIDAAELETLLLDRARPGERVVVALAGAPGSGKSSMADRLVEGLNARSRNTAAVLPMDGFHYDDLYLVPAGLRDRKGAPETFDVGGLRQTLLRIRSRAERFVAVPVFDRDLEIARAGARLIPADVPVVIVEGNYLLLDRDPWSSLRPLFDVAVLLDVPEPSLMARLEQRWRGYGLNPEEIRAKIAGNDLPNGRLVTEASRGEDFRIEND